MTADEYSQLEKCLAGCEEIATDRTLWTVKDRELRDEIRAVLAKVTVERIRAEEGEGRGKGKEDEPRS